MRAVWIGTVILYLLLAIGINGNEEADKAAKEALSMDVLPFNVPFTDFKPLINDFIQDIWQRSWCDPPPAGRGVEFAGCRPAEW